MRCRRCVQDRMAVGTTEASLPLSYSLIPGSNGGYGRRVHFQLRITNASSRTVRNATVILEARWNQAGMGPGDRAGRNSLSPEDSLGPHRGINGDLPADQNLGLDRVLQLSSRCDLVEARLRHLDCADEGAAPVRPGVERGTHALEARSLDGERFTRR
jgi:hypothetical protein